MSDEAGKGESAPHWITRALFLRGLGCIYFVAFLAIALQVRPLLGSHGLLPITLFQRELKMHGIGFSRLPSLFWFVLDDSLLVSLAWAGVALSTTVVLGYATSVSLFVLWALYLSYVSMGQIFLGYGWESLLLETGFLALFLAPAFRPGEFSRNNPPMRILFFLLYWLLFRLMFGAGMIKIHGDECWRDLTCLEYHFETQPLPNPLSWLFQALPFSALHVGVACNHFVELIAPWLLFLGRKLRRWGGISIILFQTTLILSGNLSWLNYLTIVIAISCFDDHSLWLIVPRRWKSRFLSEEQGQISSWRKGAVYGYTILIGCLSIAPAVNLFSSRQMMNASFDRFLLVNTYGAFGTVGKERYEIVMQGTDAEIVDERTQWKEYEFKCKPGSVERRPCIVAPYQYRLDWQIWFAAMSTFEREPWLVNFVAKLLNGDSDAATLLASNPFPDKPPKFIRGQLYRYRLANPKTGAWWTREFAGPYFSPIEKDSRALREFLVQAGLSDSERPGFDPPVQAPVEDEE